VARYTYTGLDPCQLVDGEFVVNLEPGQEFDAPDSFVPEPNPHPSFQPVNAKAKSAPATAPQE
jgi:hypothetical protein